MVVAAVRSAFLVRFAEDSRSRHFKIATTDGMEKNMDIGEIQTWFGGLTQHQKVKALIIIMRELTIVMRSIYVYYPDNCETRWRLAYHISEMNHAFTQAAWALMDNESTYPDDALIRILLEQENYPEIAGDCRRVMEDTVRNLKDRSK